MRSKLLNADPRSLMRSCSTPVTRSPANSANSCESRRSRPPRSPRSAHSAAPCSGISSGKPSNTRKSPSASKSRSCRCSAMSRSAIRAQPCISRRFWAKPMAAWRRRRSQTPERDVIGDQPMPVLLESGAQQAKVRRPPRFSAPPMLRKAAVGLAKNMTPMREVARSKGGRFELKHLRVPEQ